MTEANIRIPDRIAPGDVIAVESVVVHPIVSATFARADAAPPACHIQEAVVLYDGREVARFTWASGITGDPVVRFRLLADREAPLTMVCRDNRGAIFEKSIDVVFHPRRDEAAPPR